MDVKETLSQYSVLIVGLLLGGGFAFGGIASYAGVVGGNTPQQQQQGNYSMPSTNFVNGTYGLSFRQQRKLAANNDVVFVNVLYGKQSSFGFLKGMGSRYNNRVYVQLTNASTGSLVTSEFGISSYPSAVVVGGSRNGVKIVRDFGQAEVESAVCGVMRSWDSLAAKCQAQ